MPLGKTELVLKWWNYLLTDPIVLAQIETATEASPPPAGSAAAPSDDELSRRATTGEIYSEEAAKYFQCGNGNGTPKILTRTSSCKLSAFGLITAEPRVLPGMTLTTVAVERTTKKIPSIRLSKKVP